MTKIDIYSGFLGAGKTTLIKKMVSEGYCGEKLVLIENEFGEIGIDSGFLQDAGINITEMNSGCICCSLVGDFGKALSKVIQEYAPDRILIEPSGVGKLSDVIAAVNKVTSDEVTLGHTVAVVDAGKVKVYMKNFGEFYNNQVETASTIILSRTDSIPQKKLETAVSLLREHNAEATVVTTPWSELTGEQLLDAMDGNASLAASLAALIHEHEHHHHHDDDEQCCCHEGHDHHHHHEGDHGSREGYEHKHHHNDEPRCCHGEHEHHHHHDDDEQCCCHEVHDHHHHHGGDHGSHEGYEHKHHHNDEHCCHGEHEHHHHHHDDEHCCCHEEHDHHHHHADDVFTSWGIETAKKFDAHEIEHVLSAFDSGEYGIILRAKGIVTAADGSWIHFDYVPGESNIRTGSADVTGKLCVIGSQLNEDKIATLFGV